MKIEIDHSLVRTDFIIEKVEAMDDLYLFKIETHDKSEKDPIDFNHQTHFFTRAQIEQLRDGLAKV